jgi:integrase
MALFDVNTGLRDQELCNLQWNWEQRVPELDTSEIKRSVFVLPTTGVKNRQARVVILNDIAQSVLEEVRGEHQCMFTWGTEGSGIGWGTSVGRGWIRPGGGRRRGMSWSSARRRLRAKNVRVHDLRHTFGRRLRNWRVLRGPTGSLGHRSTR